MHTHWVCIFIKGAKDEKSLDQFISHCSDRFSLFWFETNSVSTHGRIKTIELKIVLNDTDILFEESVQTDALTLGELIEEVDAFYEAISVEYSGSKTDAYGRMLLAINEHKTEDMSTGPWWLVESETNVDCVAAGYCNGIDLQSIYDQDHFELDFTSSY